MQAYYHTFYIPVMGTGHTVDTPIRVAHLGINSVVSLVDDILLDRIRKYYSEKFGLPYFKILPDEEDGRAKRITAYLDMVREIVHIKMEAIKKQPFFTSSDKVKYFELLPDESILKKLYNKFFKMKEGDEKRALEEELTHKMRPGSIDVNIMVKLDKVNFNNGSPLSDKFSDAKAALRGYVNSSLKSGIVFSAGINQSLFNYMTQFSDFYRNKVGEIKKSIILKVSDFRSALIQGKLMAKKGLEVAEFRIESGLHCGGHAFPSNGFVLPYILQEFKEKREQLEKMFKPLIKKYYKKMDWKYTETSIKNRPLITVQGGIGTNGEVHRLRKDFNIDLTGWASPFLLVPEATCVDASTREILRKAGKEELYISDVSPLEIPFNNVRCSGSEMWTRERIKKGNPGSPCPKGLLISNTEYTEKPICLASRQYQKKKLEEISKLEISNDKKEKLYAQILEKTCICDHLGNGALISLGIAEENNSPQSICPGPNLAWFDRLYSLKEMIDHIYGRGESLVLSERPHMFAKEIEMYVDYFEKQVTQSSYSLKEIKNLKESKKNLEDGMDFCLNIAERQPYDGENLASIPPCIEQQRLRLKSIYDVFEMNIEKKCYMKINHRT